MHDLSQAAFGWLAHSPKALSRTIPGTTFGIRSAELKMCLASSVVADETVFITGFPRCIPPTTILGAKAIPILIATTIASPFDASVAPIAVVINRTGILIGRRGRSPKRKAARISMGCGIGSKSFSWARGVDCIRVVVRDVALHLNLMVRDQTPVNCR